MRVRTLGVYVTLLCSVIWAFPASAGTESYAVGMVNYPGAVFQTQVAIGPCVTITPTEKKGLGLGGTILSAAISAGINLISSILKHAADDKAWISAANRNVDSLAAITGQECIQVVRGQFSTTENPDIAPDEGTAGKWFPQADAGVIGRLWHANRIWLTKQPEFFFEGRFIASKGAIKIFPVYAMLHNPAGSGRGKRSVSVSFAFTQPAEHVDAPNCPAALIVLGELAVDQPLVFRRAEPSDWNTYESQWFTLGSSDVAKPHIVSAVETETEPGSKFAQFLLTIFNQPEVQQAITQQAQVLLIPSVAQDAKNLAATAADTAMGDYDSKLLAALNELDTCSNNPSPAEAVSARSRLRDYAAISRTLGRRDAGTVQALIDKIDIKGSNDAIAQACSAAEASLKARLNSRVGHSSWKRTWHQVGQLHCDHTSGEIMLQLQKMRMRLEPYFRRLVSLVMLSAVLSSCAGTNVRTFPTLDKDTPGIFLEAPSDVVSKALGPAVPPVPEGGINLTKVSEGIRPKSL